MKINRPTDEPVVVHFGALGCGDCFEFCGSLFMKTANCTANALRLREDGAMIMQFDLADQCTIVDVEISYTYRRQKETEHNG